MLFCSRAESSASAPHLAPQCVLLLIIRLHFYGISALLHCSKKCSLAKNLLLKYINSAHSKRIFPVKHYWLFTVHLRVFYCSSEGLGHFSSFSSVSGHGRAAVRQSPGHCVFPSVQSWSVELCRSEQTGICLNCWMFHEHPFPFQLVCTGCHAESGLGGRCREQCGGPSSPAKVVTCHAPQAPHTWGICGYFCPAQGLAEV